MKYFKYLATVLVLFFTSNVFALETTSTHIDLNKYLGKWYEIARFDSWFEKDCVSVTAEYSLNNNIIDVVNSCRLKTATGKFKQAHGRAVVVPNSNNTKLKVSFLPKFLNILDSMFAGDYWILKIDPDYQVVLVGAPSKKYLWILSRNANLDPKIYAEYVEYAKSIGFDVAKLHKTLQ